MDVGIIVAIAMLVAWAVGTVREAPGWIHGLLIAGLFLLFYRIVARGTPPVAPDSSDR